MDPLLIDVPERLVTERLIIRAHRPGDGVAVHAAVQDSVDELRPWVPWARATPTVEETEAEARRSIARFVTREDLRFVLLSREGLDGEGIVLGGTGLHRMDWDVPRFEIGYWRRSGHGGRGIVTEAVRAVSRMAFDVLGAQRVEIRMDDRNERSWRVAERAGFTLEGVLRRDGLGPDGSLRDTRVYARVRGIEEATG